MTADGDCDRSEPGEHRFSLEGRRLADYYESGDSLQAKHRATNAAADRFPAWVLDLIDDVLVTRALDVGCGWGRFAMPFLQRRPLTSPALTCADVYHGMLATTRRSLTEADLPATYAVANIDALPFSDRAFDLVLANHVLYHATSVVTAVANLARVLGDDGTVIATTDSDLVRVPLIEIHRAALDELGVSAPPEGRSPFSLENGAEQLATAFEHVDTHVFEHIVHYDVDTLVIVYLNSGRYRTAMADTAIDQRSRDQLAARFRSHAERWLSDEGAIASPQRLCAFIGRGRRI